MWRGTSSSDAHLAYLQQDSAQTLCEGLQEYYAANVGTVTRPSDLPLDSASLFVSHDICHVIFGLSVTLDDEALVDARTLLSCDVGVRRYAIYLSQDKQAKALFKKLGYLKSAWVTILALPRICSAVREAWRMEKRWPWVPPDSFLNRTLADLRDEFGIRVV